MLSLSEKTDFEARADVQVCDGSGRGSTLTERPAASPPGFHPGPANCLADSVMAKPRSPAEAVRFFVRAARGLGAGRHRPWRGVDPLDEATPERPRANRNHLAGPARPRGSPWGRFLRRQRNHERESMPGLCKRRPTPPLPCGIWPQRARRSRKASCTTRNFLRLSPRSCRLCASRGLSQSATSPPSMRTLATPSTSTDTVQTKTRSAC